MNDLPPATSARDAMLQLRDRVGQSVVGQTRMIERLVLGLLADGHVLIEGLPGLAKTRAVKSLSRCLEIGIQPDSVHPRPAALRRHRRRDLSRHR